MLILSLRKRRPLGIPLIVDRCLQARVVNALEPEWVIMINAVDRRRQIRFERPPSPGVGTPGDVEDGLDRVVAATARPKPVGLRFEPCFPLGFAPPARRCASRA